MWHSAVQCRDCFFCMLVDIVLDREILDGTSGCPQEVPAGGQHTPGIARLTQQVADHAYLWRFGSRLLDFVSEIRINILDCLHPLQHHRYRYHKRMIGQIYMRNGISAGLAVAPYVNLSISFCVMEAIEPVCDSSLFFCVVLYLCLTKGKQNAWMCGTDLNGRAAKV